LSGPEEGYFVRSKLDIYDFIKMSFENHDETVRPLRVQMHLYFLVIK